MLAVGSTAWLVANDRPGLQTELHSIARNPNVRYAMVLGRDGRVLASNEVGDIGMRVDDAVSRAWLAKPVPRAALLVDNADLVDVAEPVFISSRHLGWVRIGWGRAQMQDNLAAVKRRGYVVGAFAVGFAVLLAMLIAHRPDQRPAPADGGGQCGRQGRAQRACGPGPGKHDEIGALGASINGMLDHLAESERERMVTEEEIRSLAYYDPLTHLPNRRMLIERLRHAMVGSSRTGRALRCCSSTWITSRPSTTRSATTWATCSCCRWAPA
ncbi:hypothetical protein LP419_10920 [Massilia sp. H-1]|nr:hypothetical protein LP419_10920 [Massilia sp. H-1]